MGETGSFSERLLSIAGPADAWWSPRRKRFWAWLLLLIYTLTGFLLAPWVAKRELLSAIELQTGLKASLQELHVNPYVLSVEALGFAATQADGSPVTGFSRLFLNFQLSSLFRRALTFRDIQLDSPYLNVVRAEDGSLNLQALVEPAGQPDSAPSAGDRQGDDDLLRVIVFAFELDNGVVDVTDRVPRTDFQTQLGPLNIQLTNLSTLPDATGRQAVVVTSPRGLRLEWTGDISVNPLGSRGRLTGSGPYLPVLYQYLQDEVLFEVTEGEAEVAFDYVIEWPQGSDFQLAISNLDLDVRGVLLRGDEPPEEFLSLPEQSLRGGYLDLAGHSAGAQSYVISGPRLRLARDADGLLNLQKLLPPEQAAEPSTPAADNEASQVAEAAEPDTDQAAPQPPAWELSLGRFEINQLAVEFTDQSLRGEPATLTLDPVRLEVSEISNRAAARFPFSLAASVASGGQLDASGEVAALPAVDLRADIEVTDLALPAIGSYLAELAQVKVRDAVLQSKLQLVIDADDPLAVSGSAALSQLDLHDTVKDEKLIGWRELAVDRFEYSSSAQRLDISEIRLDAPYGRLFIAEDGSTNFQQLSVPAETVDQSSAPPAEAPAPLAITLGRVRISDGSADFTDLALPFPFATRISALKGEITTLATQSEEPAKLSLDGRVDEYGLAKVEGSLNPFNPTAKTDIRLLFRNVELPDLTPYTVSFAGRRIDDGRLELDLRYKVDQGKLKGENSIVIDRLTLGDKVDYPGAMSLPLGLAVALLKKPDGTIDIDLPVTGDVNEPEFSVAGVVFRAFANLIVKLATSPFRLLGGLVGADSEDFDRIEFTPGTAAFSPPEEEKLAKLGEALALRPGLGVKLPGAVDPEADAAALRALRVHAAVESLLTEETGRAAEQMLMVRQRRALETLVQDRLPGLELGALQANYQRPENTDKPEGRQVLDENAYLTGLREQLLANEVVSGADLDKLAAERAEAIRSRLTADGSVAVDRISTAGRVDAKLNEGGWVPLKLEAGSSTAAD